MIYFTSSWDDGSVHDIKLSEILLKYNQEATFFIPISNVENREVISSKLIKNLSDNFEIGGHTLNHKYLTSIPDKEAEIQIKQCKIQLENITGKEINGFCFPGGKYTNVHLRIVREAGFNYARTINMFRFKNEKSLINTTLQAYDHKKIIYIKHLLKRGYLKEIIKYSPSIFRNHGWENLMIDLLNKKIKEAENNNPIILHLWGHSWEIDENNQWQRLENFLKLLNSYNITSKTNNTIAQLNLTS